MFILATRLGVCAVADTPTLSFPALLPGFLLVGMGIGFAGSQLNNVILSAIPPERSGAASGANTTVRMIGASLGIAVISSLLSTQTSRGSVVTGAHTPLVFASVLVFCAFALS